MARIPLIVILYLVTTGIRSEGNQTEMAAPASVFRTEQEGNKLVSANTQFAFELYKQLLTETDGNLFLSPASISIALGMTYIGARENTANEMKQVLGFKEVADEHLHPSFEDVLSALKSTDDKYALLTANRLYCEQTFNLLPEFTNMTKTHYKAEVAAVDFKSNHESVRKQINQWVEDQTAEKIRDLLAEPDLNPLVRLVLVNAIYFKGDWKNKFKDSATKDGDFHVSEEKKTQVPLMFQKTEFNLGFNTDVKSWIIELPYVDDKLSMFVVLPDKLNGLQKLEESLTMTHLLSPEQEFHMRSTKVRVTLPRFKLEQSFGLGDTLAAMGMRDLFDEQKADLSGISGGRDLFVSKVVHKAFIEVNEEGSEAAAATAVVMMLRAAPREPEFKANHPFLFFIRENATKSILFFGKMVEPPQSGASDAGSTTQQQTQSKMEL